MTEGHNHRDFGVTFNKRELPLLSVILFATGTLFWSLHLQSEQVMQQTIVHEDGNLTRFMRRGHNTTFSKSPKCKIEHIVSYGTYVAWVLDARTLPINSAYNIEATVSAPSDGSYYGSMHN